MTESKSIVHYVTPKRTHTRHLTVLCRDVNLDLRILDWTGISTVGWVERVQANPYQQQ